MVERKGEMTQEVIAKGQFVTYLNNIIVEKVDNSSIESSKEDFSLSTADQ